MQDIWTLEHQEIQQLREEIRKLREEQERQKKDLEESKSSKKDGNDSKKDEDGDSKKEDPKRAEGPKKDQEKDDGGDKQEEKKPHPVRNALIIAGVMVLAVSGLIWWLHSRQFENTDDAVVEGHISGVAAQISGNITGVYFEENQFVKAGQVIVDVDPRDYKNAVEQARSQVAQAQAEILAERPNIPTTEVTNQTNISTSSSDVVSAEAGVIAAERDYDAARAKIREAEANSAKAQADVERYRPLAEKDEVPREQFDQVVANAKALAATVAAAQATAASSQKQVEQKRTELQQAQARAEEVRRNAPRQVAIREANLASKESAAAAARSQLDQAILNLSYCKITSPVDGIVAKRTAEVGQHLAPGQEVALITQINDLWVTANFRETQLRRMHPGQSARIRVDALGAEFDGYLESMPAATGAITSLLPPENATGNYVKVVQRMPVRLRFKSNQAGLERLRPGMSVEPNIRVQ